MTSRPEPVPLDRTTLNQVEPWLRGTLTDVDALRRQVLHALELTTEDIHRWCASLSDAEVNVHPLGLPSVAFQVRHIGRSLDRLLTYAEGRPLSAEQHIALAAESLPDATTLSLLEEFDIALRISADRIRAMDPSRYASPRGVGRENLPTTVAGLLIHCAEHTQRHTGQAITTTKVIVAQRAV